MDGVDDLPSSPNLSCVESEDQSDSDSWQPDDEEQAEEEEEESENEFGEEPEEPEEEPEGEEEEEARDDAANPEVLFWSDSDAEPEERPPCKKTKVQDGNVGR